MVCLVHREIPGVDGRSRAGTGGVARYSTAVSQTMIGSPLERFDPGEEGLRTARPPAGRQDVYRNPAPGFRAKMHGLPPRRRRCRPRRDTVRNSSLSAWLPSSPTTHAATPGKGFERIGQRDAAIAPEHVAAVRGHGDSGTEPEVLRFPFEPRRVARREPQCPSLLRQLARNGASDCPRGPEDQRRFRHVVHCTVFLLFPCAMASEPSCRTSTSPSAWDGLAGRWRKRVLALSGGRRGWSRGRSPPASAAKATDHESGEHEARRDGRRNRGACRVLRVGATSPATRRPRGSSRYARAGGWRMSARTRSGSGPPGSPTSAAGAVRDPRRSVRRTP